MAEKRCRLKLFNSTGNNDSIIHNSYAKLLFFLSFFYTLAFSTGGLLFHILDYSCSVSMNERIQSYFSVSFSRCEHMLDFLNLILNISISDLSYAFMIFTAGFTMLAGIVIPLLLSFRGFALGYSVAYFTYAARNNIVIFEHPYLSAILYSVICALVSVLMIHLGVKTIAFSKELKLLCGNMNMIIKSKRLYFQFGLFIVDLGAIIILNMIRCVI